MIAIAFLLLVAYGIQVFSPLRLDTDGSRYLSMAMSHVLGKSDLGTGSDKSFPVGYSYWIALLDYMGLANNHVFVFCNIAFLIGSLYFFSFLLRENNRVDRKVVWLVILCVPLSWVVVKHSTKILPESMFMAVSAFALYALHRSIRTPWFLFPAVVFIVVATMTRTIGVALIPALVWSVFCIASSLGYCRRFYNSCKPVVWLAGSLCGIVVILNVVLVIPSRYFENLIIGFDNEFFGKHIAGRSLEMGELMFNLPVNKAPAFAIYPFIVLGLVAFILLCIGLFSRRIHLWKSVDVYMMTYLGILLVWPYYATRFWIPVLPLVFAYILDGADKLKLLRLRLLAPAAFYYLATGILALGYSTSITFAGDRFPKLYGGGSYREPYEFAMHADEPITEYDGPNKNVAKLVRRYQYGIVTDADENP